MKNTFLNEPPRRQERQVKKESISAIDDFVGWALPTELANFTLLESSQTMELLPSSYATIVRWFQDSVSLQYPRHRQLGLYFVEAHVQRCVDLSDCDSD